jgi:hypothetical protein
MAKDPLDLVLTMARDWTDPAVVRDAPDRVPPVIHQLIEWCEALSEQIEEHHHFRVTLMAQVNMWRFESDNLTPASEDGSQALLECAYDLEQLLNKPPSAPE